MKPCTSASEKPGKVVYNSKKKDLLLLRNSGDAPRPSSLRSESLLLSEQQLHCILGAPNALKAMYKYDEDCATRRLSSTFAAGETTTGDSIPRPVTHRDRMLVVDWLSQVCQCLNWQEKTFLTAVNTFDRYALKNHLRGKDVLLTSQLPVLSVACLFIASHMQEYCCDETINQVGMSLFFDQATSRNRSLVKEAQIEIVDCLDGQLLMKTPLDFSILFLSQLKLSPEHGKFYGELILWGGGLLFVIQVLKDAMTYSAIYTTDVGISGSRLVGSLLCAMLQKARNQALPIARIERLCYDVFMLPPTALDETVLQYADHVLRKVLEAAHTGTTIRVNHSQPISHDIAVLRHTYRQFVTPHNCQRQVRPLVD